MEIKSFRQSSTFKSIFLWWLHFYTMVVNEKLGDDVVDFKFIPRSRIFMSHLPLFLAKLCLTTIITTDFPLSLTFYLWFQEVQGLLREKNPLFFPKSFWSTPEFSHQFKYSRKISGNENVWTSPESFLRSAAFRHSSISTVTPSITFSYGKTGSWRSYWPWKSWWWSYIPVVHVHCKN